MVEDDVDPVRASAADDTPPAPVARGGILAIWVILGMFFGSAVGILLVQALPGGFAFAWAIGLGVGVALGAAIGSRRADAKDREIARRASEVPDER